MKKITYNMILLLTEPQDILDPYLVPIPNQKPKPRWAQKLLDVVGSGAGVPEDKIRTRSEYQNEHAALSLTEWCNKFPG